MESRIVDPKSRIGMTPHFRLKAAWCTLIRLIGRKVKFYQVGIVTIEAVCFVGAMVTWHICYEQLFLNQVETNFKEDLKNKSGMTPDVTARGAVRTLGSAVTVRIVVIVASAYLHLSSHWLRRKRPILSTLSVNTHVHVNKIKVKTASCDDSHDKDERSDSATFCHIQGNPWLISYFFSRPSRTSFREVEHADLALGIRKA